MPHSQKLSINMQVWPEVWLAYKEQCYRHGVRLGDTIGELIAQWTEQRRREGIPAYMRKEKRDGDQ
jgi:hypothetical protein